ncbi:MAG: hypothetical protein V3S24_22695, partial [Candidatus Tectomicrobia bacterium]
LPGLAAESLVGRRGLEPRTPPRTGGRHSLPPAFETGANRATELGPSHHDRDAPLLAHRIREAGGERPDSNRRPSRWQGDAGLEFIESVDSSFTIAQAGRV